MKLWRHGFLILALLVTGGMAGAQDFRGSLVGRVLDASGGQVPSATIQIQAQGFSLLRKTSSDARGEFRFDDLLPGTYVVIVNVPGFAEARSDVTVAVGSARSITVTIVPASVQQTVKVQGAASSITTQSIDLTSAVHQATITRQDLAMLPLAHRSFANIAYLAAGTEPVEPSDPTKARITAVASGGSSGLNMELSVDGADNSDDYIGGFLQNFSPDAVQEFALRTAQEDADVGRTTGASTVITTRHGTDNWHGELGFYERAAALNARFPIENPAPQPKQPFSRQNYTGTLGGPIQKGKIWFFSSLEYVHENASISYSPASLTQFQALAQLAQQGLIPGVSSIAVPDNMPVPFHDALAMVRLDWAQSARSQWFLRVAADNYLTRNDLVQQAALPSTGAMSFANYWNLAASNQFEFTPTWLGTLTLAGSFLHHTESRNGNLGFALAFPFSATSRTISGFETFGDNQFVTPITAFPVLRNQEKYQVRYDVSHSMGHHAPRFGVDFIHEPVLSGALPGTAENLTTFAMDPADYTGNPQQFIVDLNCNPGETGLEVTPGTTCTSTTAGDGSFSQNVQRLGLYAEDSWRVTPHLTVNYGLRYDTSFGLFSASGRGQSQNPAAITLQALHIALAPAAPVDYRKAFAPRLGVAYSPGKSGTTVFRAGFGLFYNDLAQNGWVQAFRSVNAAPGPCTDPRNVNPVQSSGCIPGAAAGGAGAIIDPNYKTPYALHATAGVEHSFSRTWTVSADYTHEQGVHGYRRYEYTAGVTLFSPLFASTDTANQMAFVPNISVFRTDNRSSYNALAIQVRGNLTRRFNLELNYTLSSAKTWGCVLGELFDYVNGVCDPLNPFAPGDYGPSGEDITHRAVLAGMIHAPGGFELTMLAQAESARPFTLTTPVDVNGFGDPTNDRAVVNGVQTTMDQLRGAPYIQVDLRVSRPFRYHERWTVSPFFEFFNLLNRNNPGANYVTDVSALPVNDPANVTAICLNAACSQSVPVNSPNQLRVPAGALGDFFGPGTTVGIPFAAQAGIRVSF